MKTLFATAFLSLLALRVALCYLLWSGFSLI
jgi:hypothetical protein